MSSETKQRRGVRTKAVLPVRIKAKDRSGKVFEELAHTLDVTAQGARLGSIHHDIDVGDEITLFYRQRKMQFRVVWTKKMSGTSEFQVGLQALAQDKEGWGLGSQFSQAAAAASVSA
jgi:PilZ domain